jgi:hypothetical protein
MFAERPATKAPNTGDRADCTANGAVPPLIAPAFGGARFVREVLTDTYVGEALRITTNYVSARSIAILERLTKPAQRAGRVHGRHLPAA